MIQSMHYSAATAPVALTAVAVLSLGMVDLASDHSFKVLTSHNQPVSARPVRQSWYERQANIIKALPHNWDQYGAAPPTPATVDRITALLREYLPPNALSGSIVPGADGSVQAEWHTQKLSIGLLAEDDGSISCWVRAQGAADETERAGFEAIDLFSTVARTSLA